jgi:NACHT domain
MERGVQEELAPRVVGRAEELAQLWYMLEPRGPRVMWVHGVAGIGKSALLRAFTAEARAHGVPCVVLDCRAVEPTERGLVHAIAVATGTELSAPEEAARALAQSGDRVVLALDTYEVFRIADTWLRQTFLRLLAQHVRVVISGREPPPSAWYLTTAWENAFQALSLGTLADSDCAELLRQVDAPVRAIARIKQLARGHPLALKIAAAAARERPALQVETVTAERVFDEIVRIYVEDLPPDTRRALEAATVVRRVTVSLLAAMLPDVPPEVTFERLRRLPFTELTRDGLMVHETMQQTIAATVRAADPVRYRHYRRTAWRQLRAELREAGTPELWRYTADMLYLIENPIVREAFFPTGAADYVVEPAQSEDGLAITGLIDLHEPHAAGRELKRWWERTPESFRTVRDPQGLVAGFYVLLDARGVERQWIADSALTRAWAEHLRRNPVPPNQRTLFNPRWLSRDHGELPSPVVAACFLDIKRVYVEMRPHLRRIYTAVKDTTTFIPIMTNLGFRPTPEASVMFDDAIYHTLVLDFGPASVDGWLTWLAGSELAAEDAANGLLDVAAQELVIDGERTHSP